MMRSSIVRLAAAAAMVMVGMSAASAAVVDITGISGVWTNGAPAATISGEGTNSISWGVPADVRPSGYMFTAAPTPLLDAGSPFHLGDFTHHNFPVFAPTMTSVDLEVSIAGTIDGVAFALTPSFTFSHFETPNVGPCAPTGATICPDVVTFLSSHDLSEVVTVGGRDFTLIINGFEQGGDLVSSFVTEENRSNTAALFASIVEPALIPLPAAGWLLVTGFLGLGVVRRRKR